LFVFLKFPLGLFAFVMLMTFISFSLSLLSAPIMYFLIKGGIVPSSVYQIGTYSIGGDPLFAVFGFIVGFFMCFISLHLFNGIAYVNGILARGLLGSEKNNEKAEPAKKKAKKEK